MNITVIVPTYCRPNDLARCLDALSRQIRLPHQVVVVVRDTDADTWALLNTLQFFTLPLSTVKITVPGVIAAMNAGLEVATGDVVAFTDDDAAPHVDWIERLETHFLLDNRIGGVGGRDCIQRTEPWFTGKRKVVGRLQWYGRMIGDHHMGIGEAREVDFLKGVNMSFRRDAIGDLRFDTRLLGTGAQVHFEVAFCLALKQKGWKLIYDPAVKVDHYLAKRFDEDQRDYFNAVAFFNEVHNETLATLNYLSPVQRIVFFVWLVLVGTRRAFGFVQFLRHLPLEGKLSWQKWMVSVRGRRQGLLTWLSQKDDCLPSSEIVPD